LIANNLAQNLYRFYQSRNKVLLYVGAGGGQLLDTSADFSKLIAVDQNSGVDARRCSMRIRPRQGAKG
jgi:hypothetical protein